MVAPSQGFTVAVRAKPGAKFAHVGGHHLGPYGNAVVVKVMARAVDGAATEAIRRSLAQALGVRTSAVSLRRGHSSRDKLFVIDPWPSDIQQRIWQLMEPS
ncbi:MAG: DUF167 domain-containing protein [Corynebacteriales bacterium]|nr:DUF167 domain-containing protein [Mycobacteriales bacterium]